MNKIIIVVKGGSVQEVYSSCDNQDIQVLDYDNEDNPNNNMLERKLDSMICIY